MPRIPAILFFVAVALGSVAPPANAVPAAKIDATLGTLWTTVLESPSAQNPFGSGGNKFACWDLGGTVAPFSATPVDSCTVKPGTKLFIVASSVECSTFPGDCGAGATTEAQLRDLARQGDAQVAPSVTLDGKTVAVTEAETGLLNIVLPTDNIFSQPAGAAGQSVAHGWVTFLHPLTPGTHTIAISSDTADITTTIIVGPGN